MIVNGRVGFVGSKCKVAQEAVTRELQIPGEASLRLETETHTSGHLVLENYDVVAAEEPLLLKSGPCGKQVTFARSSR